MEILWKICLGIIAIPFLLWGLSFVFQVLLGASFGIASLFGMIWDKEEKLSFKEGLITGVVFVLGRSILLLLFGFILSFVGKGESLLDGISLIISLLTIIIFLISLFRMKFKFAFSFMFTNEVLLTLIIKIFY